jgi:hypothetical protein
MGVTNADGGGARNTQIAVQENTRPWWSLVDEFNALLGGRSGYMSQDS